MYKVVGIILDSSNHLYYFSPRNLLLKQDEKVVVETEHGQALGTVKTEIKNEKKENVVLPLKEIDRIATPEDIEQFEKNKSDCINILKTAKKYNKELNLDMNFIEANYTLDRSRLFLSFLADSRVDFRVIAKKLAQKYHTRIELRQIGVRDKAKKIGGLGPCGLFLCCNTFLSDFNSVSINMAKNQFLALNPTKINGVCGRLMCCLNYEDQTYKELKKGLPKMGALIETSEGMGKVIAVDIFKQTYKVDLKNKGILDFSIEDNVKNK